MGDTKNDDVSSLNDIMNKKVYTEKITHTHPKPNENIDIFKKDVGNLGGDREAVEAIKNNMKKTKLETKTSNVPYEKVSNVDLDDKAMEELGIKTDNNSSNSKTEEKEVKKEEKSEKMSDSFFDELNAEHDKELNQERNSYINDLVRSAIQAFVPPADLLIYGIENLMKIDISKGLINGPQDMERERDSLFSKDPDTNMILNGLPKLMSTIAFFTDNQKFKIFANSMSLWMPIIQNLMAGRKPLSYKDTREGATDIIKTGINALPLIKTVVTPMINMDKIKATYSQLMEEAKYVGNGTVNGRSSFQRGNSNVVMKRSF